MTHFFVVPQWQGSPAARAMLLQGGAEAIAEDLPRSAVTRIDVPLEAGDALGSRVHRLSALTRVRTDLDQALTDATEPAIIVGGDCGVAVAGISHAAGHHERLAVVWFDAHADLHDPGSSPSGAYSGMALRAALGAGALPAFPAVEPGSVILVGARDVDDAEAAFLADSEITALSVADLDDPGALADAIAACGADAIYVHVDLDVLDPSAIHGVTEAVPFGLDVSALTKQIAAARARVPLVGASLSGFAPATRDDAVADLGAILRIIGALA